MGSKWEDLMLNLALNIFAPVLILTRFTGEEFLGPINGFIIALAFPIGYGIFDFVRNRKINFFSAIGLVSVLLTGSIGLLKLDPEVVAIKEAGVPFAIGIGILVAAKFKFDLLKKFFWKIMNEKKVYGALRKRKNVAAFEKRILKSVYMLSGTFFLSSVLNYVLAKMIVVSQPGTVEFNEQIGMMTALSYPVIALPTFVILIFVIWYLVSGTRKLTGLKIENIFKVKE